MINTHASSEVMGARKVGKREAPTSTRSATCKQQCYEQCDERGNESSFTDVQREFIHWECTESSVSEVQREFTRARNGKSGKCSYDEQYHRP